MLYSTEETQHYSANESLLLFLNPSLHYASPSAMVYGSLHFITFDGADYSFKALGEFVILRLSSSFGSNIFTLQGQTDKLHTDAKVPEMVRMAAFHQGIGKVCLLLKINPPCGDVLYKELVKINMVQHIQFVILLQLKCDTFK